MSLVQDYMISVHLVTHQQTLHREHLSLLMRSCVENMTAADGRVDVITGYANSRSSDESIVCLEGTCLILSPSSNLL